MIKNGKWHLKVRKEFIDKIQKAEKQIENGAFYTEKEMEELLLEKYAIKL